MSALETRIKRLERSRPAAPQIPDRFIIVGLSEPEWSDALIWTRTTDPETGRTIWVETFGPPPAE